MEARRSETRETPREEKVHAKRERERAHVIKNLGETQREEKVHAKRERESSQVTKSLGETQRE